MSSENYKHLTPNQRLFAAGELEHFEHSVIAGDARGMIAILLRVELNLSEAREYTQEILANPRKYGYCEGGCLRTLNRTRGRLWAALDRLDPSTFTVRQRHGLAPATGESERYPGKVTRIGCCSPRKLMHIQGWLRLRASSRFMGSPSDC